MDDIVFAYFESMQMMLTVQMDRYGPLANLVSRNTKKTSRIIDTVLNPIISYLKESSPMYKIKIFVKNINQIIAKKHLIPIVARCYNYLFLNTNFPSQYLLKKDMRYDSIIGAMPNISPYLFLQIIWNVKCEDLLVESLAHIPLDLCVEVLEITIQYINDLEWSRARRLIFLLVYKIYNKCLWLHFGTLSEQSAIIRVSQLVTYFERLLDLLVNLNLIACYSVSARKKYLQHGILIKNMLYYVEKCMHSKIVSYSENHNLAELFTLTYGSSDEHHHILPAKEVKSIILTLEQKLATVFTNQIELINHSEFMEWQNINDDENIKISLQSAIITECCHFIKIMEQNEFLVTNEHMSHCLKQLKHYIIDPKESNKHILTLPELCQDIVTGKHNMKELIKRYKEWDLSILDFMYERLDYLKITDVYVILEYLYYIFPYLHTKAEKYQCYVSVLKILINITFVNADSVVQNYIKLHFNDNPLEDLYDKTCFKNFMERQLSDHNHEIDELNICDNLRTLSIFTLLNPKKVLKKFVIYEISHRFEDNSPLFNRSISFVRGYYGLIKEHYHILLYILKDIIFKQRLKLGIHFLPFLEYAIESEIINVDDIMNHLYISYLDGHLLDKDNIYIILTHIYSLLQKNLCTLKTDFMRLILTLAKTSSLLRRNSTFAKDSIYNRIILINKIFFHLETLHLLPEKNTIISLCNIYGIEPLEINKLLPNFRTNTLRVIQEYERRCFFVHRRLRTDPRCHPKLRNYVRTFNLDREAIIRHMMLHCIPLELNMYAFDLMFIHLYHFNWADSIIAYENLMRIAVEATQIVLMYVETYPKLTFLMCLHNMLQLCKIVESNTFNSPKTIRHILLKTLSSINVIINKTRYKYMYKFLLKCLENVDQRLPRLKYFDKVFSMVEEYIHNCKAPKEMPLKDGCICQTSLHCKYHTSPLEEKITNMYNAYLFIRECIKLSTTTMQRCSDRLLHNLCLE